VYATYGTKARVLTALIDTRLAPKGQANVTERPEALAVRDEVEPRRQVHLFALDIAAISSNIRDVFEIMRTASAVEPEMAKVLAEMDSYRFQNMRKVAGWLAARGPLRVDVDRAAATIWAITSPDVARMLCDGRGFTEAEHAAWLEETLARALLP
jgi:hypothetical protein